MTRRLIIRGSLIGVLTICLAAWTWSYVYVDGVKRVDDDGERECGVAIYGGTIQFCASPASTGDGWVWSHQKYRAMPDFDGSKEGFTDKRLLGFRYFDASPASPYWFIEIPLWFPTAAFAILLCWVWRKTQSSPAARAFPVETSSNP